MKRPIVCVISAAASLIVSCAAAGELVILQPTGKDAVWLMSKRKMDYLSLPLAERVKKFADAGSRLVALVGRILRHVDGSAGLRGRASPLFFGRFLGSR